MRHMRSAISDLSCYILIIYKTWGESERTQARQPDHAISANLLFPYSTLTRKGFPHLLRLHALSLLSAGTLVPIPLKASIIPELFPIKRGPSIGPCRPAGKLKI